MTGKRFTPRGIERMIEEAGGWGQIKPSGGRTLENLEWIFEHRDELRKNYSNRWVVMYNRQVVATAKTFEQALQKVDRKKISRDEITIRHIHPVGKEPIRILRAAAQAA